MTLKKKKRTRDEYEENKERKERQAVRRPLRLSPRTLDRFIEQDES